MSSGFNVGFNYSKGDMDKLMKKYKKLKKYQKSSLFAIKTIDGTEEVISKMVKEAEDNPL